MLRAFEVEIGHFALNNAGVGPTSAGWQRLACAIAQQALPKPVRVGGMDQLAFRDSGANEAQGLDKTEPVGVQVVGQTGLVHEAAHDTMREQQGLQRLDDPDGLERAQGAGQQRLVDLNFIQGDFDFPAFRVQHTQLKGRQACWVKPGRYQARVLCMTRPGRVITHVVNDPHQQALVGAAFRVRRMPIGQPTAVREDLEQLRLDVSRPARNRTPASLS
jgi:hypothetical protein